MDEAPAPVHGGVFISYRREETTYTAGWLYDRLVDHLGRGRVFKDIDSIQLGDDWVEVINAEVASCDVLLALIGDQWLTVADGKDARLDDPHDFVRLEIEAALTRNVRVIPILVEGARMPHVDDLPPSLSLLTRRQALELSPISFDFDLGRLLPVLDRTLAEARPEPVVAAPEVAAPEVTPPEVAAPTAGTPEDAATEDAVTAAAPIVEVSAGATGPPPVLDVPVSDTDPARRRRRLVLIAASAGAAVVAIALIAAAVASGGDGSGGGATTSQQAAATTLSTSPIEVDVPAAQLWTNTHITCQAGDVLHVTARGTILHNKNVPSSTVSPDGIPGHDYDKYNVDVVPEANTASLIASVDRNDAKFVGAVGDYTCKRAGSFLLGVNDTGVDNNGGSWAAKVQLEPG